MLFYTNRFLQKVFLFERDKNEACVIGDVFSLKVFNNIK